MARRVGLKNGVGVMRWTYNTNFIHSKVLASKVKKPAKMHHINALRLTQSKEHKSMTGFRLDHSSFVQTHFPSQQCQQIARHFPDWPFG